MGMAHLGGLTDVARVPADWVLPLPAGLTLRQAMALGTAGFTAALSVERLEHMGLEPASATSDRPLERGRWAGAVDAVGGATLAYLLRTMRQGDSIAASGNTGGAEL